MYRFLYGNVQLPSGELPGENRRCLFRRRYRRLISSFREQRRFNTRFPEIRANDLFLCLDCGDQGRLGFSAPLFEQAAHTFCIDHHISNQSFAEENHIKPEASSTSELVYHLLNEDKISVSTAEALYLGIVHDTGVFQYSCTAPSTMRAAARLMEKGIDAPAIIQNTYYEKTYAQNQILGRAMLESILFMDGKCIASYFRQKTLEFYGVTPKDLDGIVSQLRNTKGVEVAIFMYEISPNEYKVSLRSSKDVDVSVIAQYFGGGGHKKAAGFTMTGSVMMFLTICPHRLRYSWEKMYDTWNHQCI